MKTKIEGRMTRDPAGGFFVSLTCEPATSEAFRISNQDMLVLERWCHRLSRLVELCREAHVAENTEGQQVGPAHLRVARWYSPEFYNAVQPVLRRLGGMLPQPSKQEGEDVWSCHCSAQPGRHTWKPGACPDDYPVTP